MTPEDIQAYEENWKFIKNAIRRNTVQMFPVELDGEHRMAMCHLDPKKKVVLPLAILLWDNPFTLVQPLNGAATDASSESQTNPTE